MFLQNNVPTGEFMIVIIKLPYFFTFATIAPLIRVVLFFPLQFSYGDVGSYFDVFVFAY